MNQQEDDYLVEWFTLDETSYDAVLEVIKAAYLANDLEEGGTILFTEKTMNILFGSPSIPRDYFMRAIYKPTGQVVGFLGGTPRMLAIEGKGTFKTGVPSYLAVHPDHRRKNLAIRMGLEMLKKGTDLGYEGGFGFFEPEARGIDTGKAIAQLTGLPSIDVIVVKRFIIRVFNIKQITTVIKTKWYEKLGLGLLQGIPRVKSDRVRKFQLQDAPRMFELMDDYRKYNQVSFLREREDIEWFLTQSGVNSVVHLDKDNQVDGFMVAWEFHLAGFGHACPCGWIDMIHTYRLKKNEAVDLCNYFAQTSKELGWMALQSPFIPYFDPAPLKKARFIFFPKILIVNFMSTSKERPVPFPERIKSTYFDWR
jgi:GNAT superfamily N-acetyltransferase